jgi:uncharacterized protein (DUF2062 family)
MRKKKWHNNILRFFKFIYLKLFRINDTPQRIALGLGLGVFLGIIPGTGPVAAVCLAWLLGLNRAAALLGSLLTNTWLSVVTFFLSIKIGSGIMKADWLDVYRGWIGFLKNFRGKDLLELTTLKIIWPVITGYFVVAFSLGLIVYLIALLVVTRIKHENKSRINLSR